MANNQPVSGVNKPKEGNERDLALKMDDYSAIFSKIELANGDLQFVVLIDTAAYKYSMLIGIQIRNQMKFLAILFAAFIGLAQCNFYELKAFISTRILHRHKYDPAKPQAV
jgi:hypothetical protein